MMIILLYTWFCIETAYFIEAAIQRYSLRALPFNTPACSGLHFVSADNACIFVGYLLHT